MEEEMGDDMSSVYDDDEPSGTGDETSDMKSESADGDTDGETGPDEFDMHARGRLSRAEIAKDPAEVQLAKWHDTLLPFEVDLITELDATNLFFINVESVIFDLISSKEIDFEGDTQFLRLMFLMEQNLRNIRDSGGVFRLVFFDGMKKLFAAAFDESVWAFRQAFLLHCRASGIDHVVFQSWYGQDWKDHVAEWSPSFFLLANDSVELEDEEDAEEDEEDDEKAKLRGLFHALMLRCLSFRTHVALLRGLQRRGNRIMAFALEPDAYDGYIDKNSKESLGELIAAEEDDEEDDGKAIAPQLEAFAKKAGDNAPGGTLLRTFLTAQFVKQTLAMCAGQADAGAQLMQMVAKALVLQEMLLRQIPMDKRAYTTTPAGSWEFFHDKIASGALGNFFSKISSSLGKLQNEELPEGLTVETSDLFDGRLYRHVFQFLVEKGIANKGKVEKAIFGLKDWVLDELDFLWKEGGSKEQFFPINMKAVLELPDIKPPSLPGKEKPRQAPELMAIESQFLTLMRPGEDEISHITLVETAEQEINDTLQQKHSWATDVYLDLVKEEERMEKSAAQKKMDEYSKLKGGKLTERDIEYRRKFDLKRRQLALRALGQYAKSLTGSNRLHPPIIMKDDKEEKGGKKEEKKEEKKAEEKISKKQQEILEAQKLKDEKKIQEHEKAQTEEWEKKIAHIPDIMELDKLEKDVLDLFLGFNRITDSFVGFPALGNSFKTSEAQAKIVVKTVKNIKAALKKMKLDKLPEADQPKVRRFVRYLFSIIQEGFNSFAKNDLDGKGIKVFQEALLCVGFKAAAEEMFKAWKELKEAAAAKEKAEAEAAAPKGGKDDKKGKDSKKDDKKDDKKDKKDKKEKDDKKDKKDKKAGKDDDDDDEKGLDSYKVKADKEDRYWSGVGNEEYSFQLRHMGPYMTRTVGTAKDPKNRVNFKPDGWQMRLLDIVDSQKSALVVAPTASGKTFIGYYVMDKVLRTDNEGVAVYVAPSKTLVNQVSAEIYARFSSKTYPANCKSELLGVFLKEYNSSGGVAEAGKWKNCQVLVTIPHILEMLLTSPSHQDWVRRLKYVVFDEVHCIGGEDGTQWEHTMQTIPCPFIALSATVADPSFFHGWLQSVNKKKKTSEVEIVIHSERWNDLYKYYWAGGELRPLHPFCCLIEKNVRLQGLSTDLSLTPEENVQLYQELAKVIGKNKTWDKLAPETWFLGKVGFIRKKDAKAYEVELKSTFLDLLKDGTLTSEGFSKLKLGLQKMPSALEFKPASVKSEFKPPPRTESETEDGEEDEEKAEATKDVSKMTKSMSYLQASTLVPLIRSLDELQYLPAIVFNFSRKDIEKMLRTLVNELKEQQRYKYYGTEEANYRSKKIMEKRMADYQKAMTAYEQALKALASKKQEGTAARKAAGDDEGRGARKTEATDVSEEMAMAEPPKPTDLADEIDMEFSFHSPKALGQWAEDIEETLTALKARKTMPSYLVDGLRRGIGMHHEGAQKQYREAVEILFRRGYLRVVFATGTLALGINMPCRSTIFCGDSLELSGLMYRQMAGRAGRRGFDLLGQVVFLDMSYLKIQRLVASDLSTLTGEFLLSPTMLLRCLHEWEQVSLDEEQEKALPRTKEDIARCLAPMFSLPFFQSKLSSLDTQVQYHTRFSLELLYNEGLIGPNGYTSGLASLVTLLFEIEPANFLLARLLSTGLLHDYLTKEAKKVKKGDRRTHLTVKLTAVLGWLLYRRRLPSVIPQERRPRKKHHPSETSPKLPPLPPKIQEELQSYNAALFEHFQQLAWSVGSTRKIGEGDLVLPVSEQQFRLGWDPRGEPFSKESELASRFIKQIVRYRARSPFSAIGGLGDYFSSPADLAKSARSVMHLDIHSFMMVAAPMLGEDGLEPTNSWILDFMIHGKKEYLWEDNGINATMAWKLISTFMEAVKKVTTALKAYSPEDDIVLATFTELGDEIKKYLG